MKNFEVILVYSNPELKVNTYVKTKDEGDAKNQAMDIAYDQFPETRATHFERWLVTETQFLGEHSIS